MSGYKKLDSQVDGEVSLSGLENGGKISHFTIDEFSWTLVPNNFSNRKSIKIVNRSADVVYYLEYDNTVPVGDGDPISPENAVSIDFEANANVNLYLCSEATSGSGNKVTINEAG